MASPRPPRSWPSAIRSSTHSRPEDAQRWKRPSRAQFPPRHGRACPGHPDRAGTALPPKRDARIKPTLANPCGLLACAGNQIGLPDSAETLGLLALLVEHAPTLERRHGARHGVRLRDLALGTWCGGVGYGGDGGRRRRVRYTRALHIAIAARRAHAGGFAI